MTRLNLTNFETVCCIVRLGGFHAAAQRLHTTQPAITARVRELQESLGITFFLRRGRKMELTPEGRRFIQRIEPFVADLDREVDAEAAPGSLKGIVLIGIAHAMLRWFPHAVAQLKVDMPEVQYDVDIDGGRSMLDKLEAGALDIAVVTGALENPRLVCLPLHRQRLQWVMARDVPTERDGSPIALADLLDSAPIWLVRRSSVAFTHALSALAAARAQLRDVNTCANMQVVIEMVVRTRGIGLTTASLARVYAGRGDTVAVPGMADESLAVTLAYHNDHRKALIRHVAKRFVEFEQRFNDDDQLN